MSTKDKTYNGWANWETWNVALWIGNDEGLYSLAKEHRRSRTPYADFRQALRDINGNTDISFETPDGVAWNDSAIDVDAINATIRDEDEDSDEELGS